MLIAVGETYGKYYLRRNQVGILSLQKRSDNIFSSVMPVAYRRCAPHVSLVCHTQSVCARRGCGNDDEFARYAIPILMSEVGDRLKVAQADASLDGFVKA